MEARVSPPWTVYESLLALPAAFPSALAPRCRPVPALDVRAPVSTRFQEPTACSELSDSSLFVRPVDELSVPCEPDGDTDGEAESSDSLDLSLLAEGEESGEPEGDAEPEPSVEDD